jgi:hypothetical protein
LVAGSFLRGAAIKPSRCACFRLSLRIRRIPSLFSRANLSDGFFVEAPTLYLAEHAFPLHLPFQYFEGLIDIVVTYEYLQNPSPKFV